MAFGNQLGSDQNLAFPRPECSEDALVCATSSRCVGVHPGDLHSGQRFLQGFFNPLCTVAEHGQLGVAGRTVWLKLSAKAAVLALKTTLSAVKHKAPNAAGRALVGSATAAAFNDRRIPAPIVEDDGLVACSRGFPQCIDQFHREGIPRFPAAHVDQFYGWQRAGGGSRRKRQGAVSTLFGILPTLPAGRCGTQDHRTACHSAPNHGEIPCVVANSVVLLVGTVVFLVHDDKPKGIEGREKC